MTWILWVMAGWLILSAVFQPVLIGKEREPVTAGGAILTSVTGFAFAAAIIFIGIF